MMKIMEKLEGYARASYTMEERSIVLNLPLIVLKAGTEQVREVADR